MKHTEAGAQTSTPIWNAEVARDRLILCIVTPAQE